MRRTCIVIALALLLPRLSPGATDARPVMALSMETWDFGTLEQGQTATTEVKVVNKGNADLKITFIRSSCAACVGNASGARVVKRGATGTITLSFYSKGLIGRQQKAVYVHSNDPEHPFKIIRLVGVVQKGPRPVLHVASDTVDVGLVPAGADTVRTLIVENKGEVPLTLSGVVTSPACRVQREGETSIAPGGKYRLRITLAGEKLKGLIQEHVTLESNDPLTPSKTVAIVGYTTGQGATNPLVRGVSIVPKGKPARVPGTGGVFYRAYQVTNRLTAAVAVKVTRPDGAVQASELSPGETTTVDVPGRAAARADDGPSGIELTIRLPAILEGS